MLVAKCSSRSKAIVCVFRRACRCEIISANSAPPTAADRSKFVMANWLSTGAAANDRSNSEIGELISACCTCNTQLLTRLRLHDFARENIQLTIFLFPYFGNLEGTNLIAAHD